MCGRSRRWWLSCRRFRLHVFMICSMVALRGWESLLAGNEAAKGKRSPGMLDLLAGRWLRAFRIAAGISREEFSGRAGFSFQQMQKYETGANRISASRLAQFAEIVERAPADFFLGAEILRKAQ